MNKEQLKIIIGCEKSQVITETFRKLGFSAFSCDIQDCEGGHPEWHIKDDILKHLNDGWHLMIAHPPCTYTSFAGTRSLDLPGRVFKRLEALEFFAELWTANIEHICLENPKSCASPVIAKYNQEIQPYYFGDEHLKTTWLWLKNLPPLQYNFSDTLFDGKTSTDKPQPISIDNTKRKKKRYFTDAIIRNPEVRAKTFPGIAQAMAEQWGEYLMNKYNMNE